MLLALHIRLRLISHSGLFKRYNQSALCLSELFDLRFQLNLLLPSLSLDSDDLSPDGVNLHIALHRGLLSAMGHVDPLRGSLNRNLLGQLAYFLDLLADLAQAALHGERVRVELVHVLEVLAGDLRVHVVDELHELAPDHLDHLRAHSYIVLHGLHHEFFHVRQLFIEQLLLRGQLLVRL